MSYPDQLEVSHSRRIVRDASARGPQRPCRPR